MTTAVAPSHAPATPFGRIVNVMRLHFANPWTTIILPWMILGFIFVANLAIWAIIFASTPASEHPDISEGLQYSGATSWIFVYMAIVAIQAISITFPFAQGYGVTRRDFYLGTALTFLVLTAMYTAGLSILSAIEEATGGWGFGGKMFTALYFGEGQLQRTFIYAALLLFFFFVGGAFGAIWVRWKGLGITAAFVILGLVLIGGGAIFALTGSWNIVGNFFAGAGLVGSFAWSLVVTAIAGIAGFFILRRATPRAA